MFCVKSYFPIFLFVKLQHFLPSYLTIFVNDTFLFIYFLLFLGSGRSPLRVVDPDFSVYKLRKQCFVNFLLISEICLGKIDMTRWRELNPVAFQAGNLLDTYNQCFGSVSFCPDRERLFFLSPDPDQDNIRVRVRKIRIL